MRKSPSCGIPLEAYGGPTLPLYRALRCSSVALLNGRHPPIQDPANMAHTSAAPPRRKSCEACVAAKRRCDLAVPFCSRCLQRNVLCVYPGRQPSANPPSSGAMESQDDTWQAGAPALPIHTDSSLFCQPEITNILEPVGSEWNSINGLQADIPIDSSWGLILSPQFELAVPRTKPLRPLSEIIASKLQFAVDVLKNAPSMMVLETQLPWCHPQLYKKYMPRVMQGRLPS